MLAYCAGKEAHALGTPRHANPYTDSEERRKWWDGWDVSLAQSLVINGDRRKTGDRLTT
jgi:ribosome modulation factor